MSEQLYFIAIVPPEGIQKEITKLKHFVADRFGSKHALNAPPHITLHMPFRWKEKKVDKLFRTIDEINEEFKPFEIELNGFDFFEPRVVFVNVVENQALNKLQKLVVDRCRKKLKLDNANYRDQAFHPHITVAHRDFNKQRFLEMRDYFVDKAYSASFSVNQGSLLSYNGRLRLWNTFDI